MKTAIRWVGIRLAESPCVCCSVNGVCPFHGRRLIPLVPSAYSKAMSDTAHLNGPSAALQPPCLELFESLPLLHLIERYRTASHVLDRRVLDLSDSQLEQSFEAESGAGLWSCRTLLGHLTDADLVFATRMRRTIAEDRPVLTLFDEHAFLDSGIYNPVPEQMSGSLAGPVVPAGGYVALLHTLRRWSGQWLATLPEQAFERPALHPERGEVRLRTLVEYAACHVEHHAWFLTRKLDLLLGAESRNAPAQGCGPGCRCA